jgi:signal transduction histidine kinase
VAAVKVARGLQAKMTASYVAVTAVAVLAVEAVVIGVVAPRALSQQELETRVRATASGYAGKLSEGAAALGRLPVALLGDQGARLTPGRAQPDSNGGVIIPLTGSGRCDPGPASFVIVVSSELTVLATSYPACYRQGAQLARLPPAVVKVVKQQAAGAGTAAAASGQVIWAAYPVLVGGAPPKGKPELPAAGPSATPGSASGGARAGGLKGTRSLGTVYLQVPAAATVSAGLNPSLVRAGLLLLVLTIPAGIGFGLLSTRRLTRRLGLLAASTLEVAGGSFDKRVRVSGNDEVSQLEENFNRMAARLAASLAAERQLAGANARHEERSRIARELHDSISQDLFSLSMLAGGLRKALPPGSPVLAEVQTMEQTASATMREMQALLLEIRPVALDELGLVAALRELCGAYRERLGVEITADLDSLLLPTTLEHAMLRVAQEAIANAVRHAGPAAIALRLHADDSCVTLEVADDGHGFDPVQQAGTAGLGLRAMRERVREQGGTLHVGPGSGRGTIVQAVFPQVKP